MPPTTNHQPPATLSIAEGLELPLSFVVGTQAILGIKGSGKSHTASVQAEELLEAGQQIVVIDPTGAWWGLRSSKDGEAAGYPVVVMGGHRADLPLPSASGRSVAGAVFRTSTSVVLDLSTFNKTERAVFVGQFLDELYKLMDGSKVLHLFADEAHGYAPQGARGEKTTSAGAMETVVSQGRIKGIGVTMITQRPQKLNKDVLTQADTLCCHRLSHNLDIAAVRDWVECTGASNVEWAGVPSLPKGEAWFWQPESGICKYVKIRDRRTFDSGKTPMPGVTLKAPKRLADVDVDSLRAAIAGPGTDTVTVGPEFGKSSTGKKVPAHYNMPGGMELHDLADRQAARIKQLEHELHAARADHEARQQSVGVYLDEIRGLLDAADGVLDATAKASREGAKVAKPRRTAKSSPPIAPMDADKGRDVVERIKLREIREERYSPGSLDAETNGATDFSPCEQAILDVLARHKGPRSRKQVAIEAGYSHKSGSYGAAVSRLLKDDLVMELDGLRITDAGRQHAKKRTAGSLLDYWNNKLSLCERTIVATLRESVEGRLGAAALAQYSNYSRTSGSYGAALAKLRDLGLISGRDPIELCKELR